MGQVINFSDYMKKKYKVEEVKREITTDEKIAILIKICYEFENDKLVPDYHGA